MIDAINVSLSSQLALERRLATIADNVANANTTGFQATGVRFDEQLDRSGTAFVSRGTSFSSQEQGALEATGGTLDVAVKGDGWFGIETAQGRAVTRDGRFSLSPEGTLQSVRGEPVLDAGGAPIQLDVAGGAPQIGEDGSIRQGGRLVGAIGVFSHDPGPNPSRVGSSAYLVSGGLEPIVDERGAGVVQGYLERSNVDAVEQMTKLIGVHRHFDNVAAAIRDSEGATEQMIRTLGGQS
ncbi:flagellar basal-body rod protein FlgF [Rhizobiaceae bacterium]|nr:flagellar basal-body rod protein FlgF [Rhizobiaceae bacterium]